MGRVFSAAIAVVSAVLLLSSGAWAYISTVSPEGKALRWVGDRKLNLAGNPKNQSGISENYFYQAIVRGLQRWKAGSADVLRFDYWQGKDDSVYEPNSEFNGLSSIYFASEHNQGASPVSGDVIALTQVWYDTDTQEILEVDIVFNDLNYDFSANAQDTSGFGSGSGVGGKVFLENVVTHELGHAFGLSHSGGLQSTMLFLEAPEQAHLGCDDQVGIRANYPADIVSLGGGISGRVVSSQGVAVFGAHVSAISRRRGTVLASAITDSSGNYTIRALEPGTYYLMVEPYYAGAQALPPHYGSINSNFCGGQEFGRSFLTDSGGAFLQGVTASVGAITTAPDLVARCGSNGGAAVTSTLASTVLSSAPQVLSAGGSGFGLVDRLSASSAPSFYKLQGVSGKLEIRVLSFSLYSPVKPVIELLDGSGSVVSTQKGEPVYTGTSGYVNFDSALVANDLPSGDYTLRISTANVDVSRYPAGAVYRDDVPFVVVTATVNAANPPFESSYPFNARCRMDENFPSYASPPGDPERSDTGGGFLGFCGSVGGSGSGMGGGSASLPDIVSWFLPFLFMALSAAGMRSKTAGRAVRHLTGVWVRRLRSIGSAGNLKA